MMRVFLTGGSGFVGRNTLEQLGSQFEFFAPSHKELDLLDENAVEKYLKSHPVDVVLHAANWGGSRKETNFTGVVPYNLRAFFNITRCQKYFRRMIFLGSGAEYDKSRELVSVKESDFGHKIPKDDYGFYKFVCSQYIRKESNIVNLRIFGLFGKYEDYEVRFISNAICKALFDLPITIKQNVYFDYVYINDFVKIIRHFLLQEPKEKFYNIGSGKKIDLASLAEMVKETSRKNLPIVINNLGLNKEYTCDNRLLTRDMAELEFTEPKAAIGELYNWYEGIKDQLKKKNFLIDP